MQIKLVSSRMPFSPASRHCEIPHWPLIFLNIFTKIIKSLKQNKRGPGRMKGGRKSPCNNTGSSDPVALVLPTAKADLSAISSLQDDPVGSFDAQYVSPANDPWRKAKSRRSTLPAFSIHPLPILRFGPGGPTYECRLQPGCLRHWLLTYSYHWEPIIPGAPGAPLGIYREFF